MSNHSVVVKNSLCDLLADGLGLREQVEIIRSAGLRVRSRHIETTERMRADHGSRALAVDVEVSHVEVALGTVDLVLRTGVDRAGETELGVVRDGQRVFEA